MTLQVTDALGCIDTKPFVHCCPTTGGIVSGNLNPTDNTLSTYTLSDVVGNYSISWSIAGGNATIATTGTNQVTVNVGTSEFILSAFLTDCSGSRYISLNINPTPVCTMTVSTPVFSC